MWAPRSPQTVWLRGPPTVAASQDILSIQDTVFHDCPGAEGWRSPAERTGLENRHGCKVVMGSNPIPSASASSPIKRGSRFVMDKVVIRNETSADVDAIAEVTVAAFKTLAISNNTEQFIVAALRAAKALTVSLAADVDGRVVGHIAFSPVAISDGSPDWYGLGPVSVLPEYQRRGIGSALIQEGISRLKALGAQGCCLVGHPEYYRRFGFQNTPGLVYEGVPEEVFFALSLDGRIPKGVVEFHPGFAADGRQEGADGAVPTRA